MTLGHAVEALRQGHWADAITACEQALLRQPEHPDAHHLKGIAHSENGELVRAIEHIRLAVRQQPKIAMYHASLGLTLKRAGDFSAASESYHQATRIEPDNAQWHYQLGLVHVVEGHAVPARNALSRALELDPALAEAASALARLLESMGVLTEAAAMAQQALVLDPSNTEAKLALADLKARRKDPDTVAAFQAIAHDSDAAPVDRSIAYSRMGLQLDSSGEVEAAWKAFTQGNALLANSNRSVVLPSVYGMAQIAGTEAHFLTDQWKQWPSSTFDDQPSPVFLVGFPRSGTTLLERMLSMHKRVVHLEEKDTLHDALSILGNQEQGWPTLNTLPDAQLQTLRGAYWNRVKRYLGRAVAFGEIVVDKLPLNSLHLELIYRLFPQAQILFAVRDPRDVCLSCFMQSFGMNDAMRNFLTIQGTVSYYIAVMSLALRMREALPLQSQEVRYEDLVDHPESVLKGVTQFLGLEWSPSLLDYYKGVTGETIDTPSYQQVSRPLYQTSRERWRRYERYIQEPFAALAPLVRALNYQPD